MKNKILTTILILLTLVFLVASIYLYVNNTNLKKEIEKGNLKITELTNDKTKLVEEKETLQSKYNLLQEDVAKIYKTCITQNACKGRFPGVSWYCNNVGDEVADYSHTCVCDSSCNLNATEIKK